MKRSRILYVCWNKARYNINNSTAAPQQRNDVVHKNQDFRFDYGLSKTTNSHRDDYICNKTGPQYQSLF